MCPPNEKAKSSNFKSINIRRLIDDYGFMMKKSAIRIHSILGLTIILPSPLAAATILLITFIHIYQKPSSTLRKNDVLFSIIFLTASAFALSPGIIAGIDEALLFLIRIALSVICLTCALIIFRADDDRPLDKYLDGCILAASINAAVVIITALSPELYHSMGIRELSGFDKSIRLYRSPGLLAGFDTSGFISVLAIIIILDRIIRKEMNNALFYTLFTMLSASIYLSSRSGMVLLIILIATVIIKRDLRAPTLKIALTVYVIPGICLAIILAAGVYRPDWISTFSFGWLQPYHIDVIYNIGSSEDYTSHYDVSLLRLFPETPTMLPDNFYFRLLAAGGIFAFIPIVAMSSTLIFDVYIAKSKGKKILFSFCAVSFIAMSLKANYFFYIPIFFFIAALYSSKNRSVY